MTQDLFYALHCTYITCLKIYIRTLPATDIIAHPFSKHFPISQFIHENAQNITHSAHTMKHTRTHKTYTLIAAAAAAAAFAYAFNEGNQE